MNTMCVWRLAPCGYLVPKSVWLTVGSLMHDGFALQLLLKRITLGEMQRKDKERGHWDVYRPVKAALTISFPSDDG